MNPAAVVLLVCAAIAWIFALDTIRARQKRKDAAAWQRYEAGVDAAVETVMGNLMHQLADEGREIMDRERTGGAHG